MTLEERNKLQISKNTRKLKEALVNHLYQHKMIIKKALPFESSKQEFLDLQ